MCVLCYQIKKKTIDAMKREFIRLIWILLFILCFTSHASAGPLIDNETEWLKLGEYTIYWGQEINASGYLIKASDFSPSMAFDMNDDYVMLKIRDNQSNSWGAILSVDNTKIPDHCIFGGRLNVSVHSVVTGSNIPVPYTNISVFLANISEPQPVTIERIDEMVEMKESRPSEIYINERAHIEVHVRNLQVIATDIQLIQDIPSKAVFDPDTDMKWNVTIPANSLELFKYSLKFIKPGTYNITGTKVLVPVDGHIYNKTFNDTQLIVHGPFFNLTKSHSIASLQPNVIMDVQVTAINEGDRAAYASLSDELPPGAVLIDGSMRGTKVVHPMGNISINYSMRLEKADNFVMPSAKLSFTDPREYKDTVCSRRYMVSMSGPDEVQTQVPPEDSTLVEDMEDRYQEPLEVLPDKGPEHVEKKDHGIFQVLYDLIDAIKKYFSK